MYVLSVVGILLNMKLQQSKAVTVFLESGQGNGKGIRLLGILSSSITNAGHNTHYTQGFPVNCDRGRLQ